MILRRAFSEVASKEAVHRQEIWKTYQRKTANLHLYLNNDKVAQALVEKTKDSFLNKPNKWVFESTPGEGVLSRRLLESGAHKLRVFDNHEKYLDNFKSLQQQFPAQLEVVDKQILDFANGYYKLLDLTREDVIRDCFRNIPIQEHWTQKSTNIHNSIVFFASLSPVFAREFLTFLVYSLCHYDTFFMNGPTEFYLFVPASNYLQMLAKPGKNLKDYTAFTVLVNSLFDFQDIELDLKDVDGLEKVKFENKQFTTISSSNFKFINDRQFKKRENYLLLKIQPKSIVNELDQEFLMNYLTFVKQSFIKRSNLAVKYYEKHFPDSTIDLIGLEISYFKALGDLTSEEMFTIFRHLYKTSQYKTSIFNV